MQLGNVKVRFEKRDRRNRIGKKRKPSDPIKRVDCIITDENGREFRGTSKVANGDKYNAEKGRCISLHRALVLKYPDTIEVEGRIEDHPNHEEHRAARTAVFDAYNTRGVSQ